MYKTDIFVQKGAIVYTNSIHKGPDHPHALSKKYVPMTYNLILRAMLRIDQNMCIWSGWVNK